jgi:transposase, IS6 family
MQSPHQTIAAQGTLRGRLRAGHHRGLTGSVAIEADHGRLKARLRPMRGLKRHRSARILAAGHAFVQNLHRGHYELATDVPARPRLREAFDQLAMAI